MYVGLDGLFYSGLLDGGQHSSIIRSLISPLNGDEIDMQCCYQIRMIELHYWRRPPLLPPLMEVMPMGVVPIVPQTGVVV